MKCIDLPQTNITLNPAPGDEEKVYTINGVLTQYPDGQQGCITAWQLEPEEIAEFCKNGIVYIGSPMPFIPMSVSATNPFGTPPHPVEENITPSGIILQ